MNEESPPFLPPSTVPTSRHTPHTSRSLQMTKRISMDPPFFLSFFFFYLVAGGVVLRFWMTGNRESRETRRRGERERMNESYAEGREKGNRVSALRALGWQTGSWVYYVYEWEGGDTLSLCPSPPLWYTPLPRPGVSVLGSCEAVAPYIDVDVSLCFFWQRFLLHSWQSGER